MRQESAKTNKKWILPVVIAAAVLVVVGIVLAIFLGPWNQGGGSETVRSKLYWNVDRAANIEAESGMSLREKGADGLYTIRFAVDGEQVELKAADKKVVNAIDFMDIMGLVFDADGLIIEALDPASIATEIAKEVFVRSFDGTTLVTNSSQAMNGMPQDIAITEATDIWDMSARAKVVGEKGTPELLDKVTIYGNEAGEVTHVFIISCAKTADVYYRVEQFYDSERGETSREPDENGVYTILFAYEGEQVEMKCKDKALVSSIDAGTDSRAQMGLVLDAEGYIIEKIPVTEALKGKLLHSQYTVTDIEGTTVTMESMWSTNKDLGEEKTMELTEECDDIFILEANCEADFVGQRMDGLKVGDRLYVYSDFNNQPVLIYIVNRRCDYPVYYSLSRKYSSKLKETTRTPDENGYYVFELAGEGKQKTMRTKDKALATKLDSFAQRIVGIKYRGDIIEDVCGPQCVSGRSALTTVGRWTTEIMGSIVRMVYDSDFEKGGNYVLSADSKIYDVSGAFSRGMAKETTLQLGDKTIALRNEANELTHVFVIQRHEAGAKIYENITRMYSTKEASTTREPDAEGYYVFDMMCEGQQVQVKTKNKDLATFVDQVQSRFIAMRVSNGIIKDAYNKAASAILYGAEQLRSTYYSGTNADKTVTYYTISNGEKKEATTTYTLASNCVIYNNSTGFISYRGEKTKMQKDDYLMAFGSTETKEILKVFVKGRKVDSPLYWPVSRKYNSTTGETTRQPDADGYYVFELLVDGQIKTFKTKDKTVASRVDYYEYAFGMKVDGDIIIQAYSSSDVKNIKGHKLRFYDIAEINGNKLSMVRTDPTSTNYGKTGELELAKNVKVYDVSYYAEYLGVPTKLEQGDRLVSYVNDDDQVVYSFVQYKCTRKAGYKSHCEHCDKEVYWQPFSSKIATQDMHYYLPADRSRDVREIGYNAATLAADPELKQYETVFDLNGHTYSASGAKRNFTVYSTLTIMDSAGGGKLVSTKVASNGANILLSSQGGATLNVYGGNLIGVTSASSGGSIHASKGTVNIYGGTISGQSAKTGGNIYITGGTDLNIYGGSVAGGVANTGGNIYINNSNLNLYGGSITDGVASSAANIKVAGADSRVKLVGKVTLTGVDVEAGALIDVSKMAANSSVKLAAEGVFTTERNDIDAVKNCFQPINEFGKITVDGNALRYTTVQVPYEDIMLAGNTVAQNAAGQDFTDYIEGTKVMCYACGKEVAWTPITTASLSGERFYALGGHYYLAEDITVAAGSNFAITVRESKTCLHLNNKGLTTTGEDTAILTYVDLNIMGNGAVTGDRNGATNGATIRTLETANLNLYGGIYKKAAACDGPIIRAENAKQVNLFGAPNGDGSYGVVIDGENNANGGSCVSLPSTSAAITFNMYGGVIRNGCGTQGGNIQAANGSIVNLYSGIISNDSVGAILAQDATVRIQDMTLKGVQLKGRSALTLVGNVQIPADNGGLQLDAGVIADISELSAESSIVVSVSRNSVFTTARDDIDTVKDCFIPADTQISIIKSGNTLSYGEPGTQPDEEPEDPSDHPLSAETIRVNEWIAANQSSFDTGTSFVTDTCPTCGATNVTWTPVGASSAGTDNAVAKGTHAYFVDSFNHTKKTLIQGSSGNTTCVYLNNKDITADGRILVGGTVNMFGNGSVTRNDSSINYAYLFIANNEVSRLNIYGGTYVSQDADADTVRLGKDGAQFNLYGGELKHTNNGTTVNVMNADNVNLMGGTVAGLINIADTTAEVKLAGPIWITPPTGVAGLTLNGVIANIDELTTDAKIHVEGELGTVISNVSTNAAAVADCFTAGEGLDVAVDANGALAIVEGEPEQPLSAETIRVNEWIAANQSSFDTGTSFVTDTCPTCGATNVTWTPVGASSAGTDNAVAKGTHAYFVDSFNHTKKTLIQGSSGSTTCVYLNNKDITADGRILVGGTVNMFGNGSVTRNDSSINYAYLFVANNAGSRLNIYGGTYVSQDADADTVRLAQDGAQFNLYGGELKHTNNGTTVSVVLADNVNLMGGTVAGLINIADTTAEVKLAGPIWITPPTGVAGLTLNGVLANIDELTTDAKIHVEGVAGTVISNVSTNATAVADCFTVAEGLKVVINGTGALEITEDVAVVQSVVEDVATAAKSTVNS